MNIPVRIPERIRQEGVFCCWRYMERNGGKTKVPYDPWTGLPARANDAATFAPFAVAVQAMQKYDGIGVGIFGEICAIDIDHCVDQEGSLSEMALDILCLMNSYAEYSPSGKGLRILFRAPGFTWDKRKYKINNQSLGLEVYCAGATSKYVTVTGNVLRDMDAQERTQGLKRVLEKYMLREPHGLPVAAPERPAGGVLKDDDIILKACAARNGAAFTALWQGDTGAYPSASEADLALCSHLAFWTGRDEKSMDRLFRRSGLYANPGRALKWDRPQAGSTYGALTIAAAARGCRECWHPSCVTRGDVLPPQGPAKRRLADLHPESNERYGWNDIGNGNLFADWYRDLARYVPERKRWFIYNGKVWRPDVENCRVMEYCKKLADRLMAHALGLEDEKLKQMYMRFAARWQRRAYRETVLKDAQSVYPVQMAAFDSDPFLFNCQNGTLNMKDGTFHAHTADDLQSRMAAAAYDPAASCGRWEQFIGEIMQDDPDKAQFLQKALGYSLTGDTRHECFFVLYGPTSRNGKSTAMETWMRLMGDYGQTGRPDSIAQKHAANGAAPSEDIASLAGARFVNIPEPDKNLMLSAALVKTLTGGDTIRARFLNENSFEFTPQFKLFINTNHLPTVTDASLFMSGRVKIVPFERHFAESEQDRGLKGELARPENLSGILNWAVEGLKMIEETGFSVPQAVRDATEEYRMNSDKIGRFLADEMMQDPLASTRTSEAYSAYKTWCDTNGFCVENSAKFKTLLAGSVTVKRARPQDGGGATTLIHGYRMKPSLKGFVQVDEQDPWGVLPWGGNNARS